MGYNQFCPIATAMDVLGERWSMLIVRELLMGGTRFNELQRGLGGISPTILTKRLQDMCDAGLIVRKKIPGQRGYEYFPSNAAKELLPILEQLGKWGMRWTQEQLTEDDYDLELLMLYLQRSVVPDELPGRENVIRFHFTDVTDKPDWWLVVKEEQVDICTHDPGRDVDVYFNVALPLMCQLWMGKRSLRDAVAKEELVLVGDSALTRSADRWLQLSIFAGIEPAERILA